MSTARPSWTSPARRSWRGAMPRDRGAARPRRQRRGPTMWAAHSDVRSRTASAVARRWSARPAGQAVLDFGGGDGGLLAAVGDQVPAFGRIMVVDPGSRGARGRPPAAFARAPVEMRARLRGTSRVDLVLAAHVLCYLDDVPAWFRSIRDLLRPGGLVTVVLTSPDCDRCSPCAPGARARGAPATCRPGGSDPCGGGRGLAVQADRVVSSLADECSDPWLEPVPVQSSERGRWPGCCAG